MCTSKLRTTRRPGGSSSKQQQQQQHSGTSGSDHAGATLNARRGCLRTCVAVAIQLQANAEHLLDGADWQDCTHHIAVGHDVWCKGHARRAGEA